MKCEAITVNQTQYSVKKMCKVLGLKESQYYQWEKQEKKREEKIKAEEWLVKLAAEEFEKSGRTYGFRRLQRALKARGAEVGEWKVRRIMRENGLYPESMKKIKPYKKGIHFHRESARVRICSCS